MFFRNLFQIISKPETIPEPRYQLIYFHNAHGFWIKYWINILYLNSLCSIDYKNSTIHYCVLKFQKDHTDVLIWITVTSIWMFIFIIAYGRDSTLLGASFVPKRYAWGCPILSWKVASEISTWMTKRYEHVFEIVFELNGAKVDMCKQNFYII